MSITKQAQDLNSSPAIATLTHIRSLEKKEYLRLSDFRAEGKTCKDCTQKTNGRYGLVWCNHHKKQVKPYNICSHHIQQR